MGPRGGARDVRAGPPRPRALGSARRPSPGRLAVTRPMPRREKSRLKARLEPALLNAVLWLLASTLGRLSWRASQRVGRAIGSLAWTLSRRDRRRALDHLALAYPELPETERRRLARGCFRHLGTVLGERLHPFHRDSPILRAGLA